MRSLPILLLWISPLLACASTPTTPAGKLGERDLQAKLPAGVKKGGDDPTKDHERLAEVCARQGSAGAAVRVRWDTFTVGENIYISGYTVELTRPLEGFTVTLADGPVGSASLEPDAPYIGAATILVKCTSESATLNGTIQIRADGKMGGPAAPKKK